MENEEDKLKKALLKKALGYTTNEVVEEYVLDEEGNKKLSKQKVTKKHISPDINAVKMLLDSFNIDSLNEIQNMSDEELLAEKERLLKILKGDDNANL